MKINFCKKGVGYRVVEKLLKINNYFKPNEKQVEVIILSKNNASISLRITNSIQKYNLDITRSGWTSGNSISNYLKAFKVDLFLSADEKDVTNAIRNGVAEHKYSFLIIKQMILIKISFILHLMVMQFFLVKRAN